MRGKPENRKIIKGFSKLTREEKLGLLLERSKDPDEIRSLVESFRHHDPDMQKLHDEFSENTITNFFLPWGVAPNFLVNGKLYMVPMVTEESSVVAAAAMSAGFWAQKGGFRAEVKEMIKTGQVHFIWKGDPCHLKDAFQEIKERFIEGTREITANMVKRGGGIRSIELVDKTGDMEGYFQVNARFDTKDSMGANFINSCLEEFATILKEYWRDNLQNSGGKSHSESQPGIHPGSQLGSQSEMEPNIKPGLQPGIQQEPEPGIPPGSKPGGHSEMDPIFKPGSHQESVPYQESGNKDELITGTDDNRKEHPVIIMSILSNYTDECLVTSEVSCRVEELIDISGEITAAEFAGKFEQAVRIAQIDVYRATTHNKGIFNGIDAVVIATGNDFRAVEAAGHTWAARDGQYRSLSTCTVENGRFLFSLTLPMAVGTVGGLTGLHPLAKASVELLGSPGAEELMGIIASAGLASNFAAISSLVTKGIQSGHMKMHLSNILTHFGADEQERVKAVEYFSERKVGFSSVEKFLKDYREKTKQ